MVWLVPSGDNDRTKRHQRDGEAALERPVERHTTAMHLLQSGVDITVIALRLGHEDTATTHHRPRPRSPPAQLRIVPNSP